MTSYPGGSNPFPPTKTYPGSKHRRNVDDCYPRDQRGGPVAAKLSALTYYINARPEKLLKVSAYLERKAERDVVKASTAHNLVTLAIVEAIMGSCSEYFASFAPTALRLIAIFGGGSDMEVIGKACKTFELFAAHAKTVLPFVTDDAFFKVYGGFVERILLMDDANPLKISIIHSILQMDDFKTAFGRERINAIIACLMSEWGENADSFKDCFIGLVQGANAVSIQYINPAILCWRGRGWPESIAQAALHLIRHLPSQLLSVFLSDLFKEIAAATTKDQRKDVEVQEQEICVLVEALGELLQSNRGPLGYSAVGIARNLQRILRRERIADDSINYATANGNRNRKLVAHTKSVYATCNAMVCLLRNATFAPQKYELINHILIKAFYPLEAATNLAKPISSGVVGVPSMTTVSLESPQESRYRSIIWSLLFAMAEEPIPAALARMAFLEVPTRLFDTLLAMISEEEDDDDRVDDSGEQQANGRLNALMLLRELLWHELTFSGHMRESSRLLDEEPRRVFTCELSKSCRFLFAKGRVALWKAALRRDCTSHHYSAIFGILKAMLDEADLTHTITSLSMMAGLLELAIDPLSHITTEHRCLMLLLATQYLRLAAGKAYLHCIDLEVLVGGLQRHLEGILSFVDLESCIDTQPAPRVGQGKGVEVFAKIPFSRSRLAAISFVGGDESARILFSPYNPEADLEAESTKKTIATTLMDAKPTTTAAAHPRSMAATLNSARSLAPPRSVQSGRSIGGGAGARSVDGGSRLPHAHHLSVLPATVFHLGLPGLRTESTSSLGGRSTTNTDDAASGSDEAMDDFEQVSLRNKTRRKEQRERSQMVLGKKI